MSDTNFPAKQPKKTIYRKVKGYPGLCTIWDWSEKRLQYVKRQIGLKFYAYRKINGVQKSKTFDTFDGAKKWRENPSLFVDEAIKSGLTFRELMVRFFEHKKGRLRVSTFETYESNSRHLRFFENLVVNQIVPRTIDSWLQAVKCPEYLKLQHKSRLSYKHELSVLRQILVYYGEYLDDSFQLPFKRRHLEDCIVDPMKYQQAKAENKVRFIPRNEAELFLEQLRAQAHQSPKEQVFADLAFFQLRTGARIGEIAALDWKDVDLEIGQISISKTVMWARKKGRKTCISPLTKTGEIRVIPMTDHLIQGLRHRQTVSGRSKGFVFSLDGFSVLSYRSIQHHYNKAFKELGFKWNSTHILRHSFATDFLEKTMNQHALQELLGHKNSKQTQHYAKVTKHLTETGIRAYEASFRDDKVVSLAEFKEQLKAKNESRKSDEAGSGWE